MKVNAINYQNNSYKNSTNFKAKFPKEDIEVLINEVKAYKLDNIYFPRLYTLLDYLAGYTKFTQALLNTNNDKKYIRVGNKAVSDHVNLDAKWYDLLLQICVNDGKEINFCRMNQSDFDRLCAENRNKTKEDILKLAL